MLHMCLEKMCILFCGRVDAMFYLFRLYYMRLLFLDVKMEILHFFVKVSLNLFKICAVSIDSFSLDGRFHVCKIWHF